MAEQMGSLADRLVEANGSPLEPYEKDLIRQAYQPIVEESIRELKSGFMGNDNEYIVVALDDLDQLRIKLAQL